MRGQFMKLFEILCIPIYLYSIFMSIELLNAAMIREETTTLNDAIVKNYMKNQCPLEDFRSFSGSAVEWLMLECLVFSFFIFTIVIKMCKSRF